MINGLFLITGDIDAQAERLLIREGKLNHHSIYKLGHHGSFSSTSLELLKTVQPFFVWNSCSKQNHFGHPDPRIMQRLFDFRIPFLSTHSEGAIFLKLIVR